MRVICTVLAALVASAAAIPMDKLEELASKYQAPVVPMPPPVENPRNSYRPVVLMHGLMDSGSNPGMQSLAASVKARYPGIFAVAVDVADFLESLFTPMQQQVDSFAKAVKAIPELKNGFNVVGLSQGGLIIRAYVEQYNDPPVHNLVSICGVQNGVFDCPLPFQILPEICDWYKSDPYHFLNNTIPLSFRDYFKLSLHEEMYLTENTFLPELNNEKSHAKSQLYKQRMISLNKVALIQATEDSVVIPYESEQFGGYEWGTKDTVFNFTRSAQATQDLLGLGSLHALGRVDLKEFVGDHIRFSDKYWHEEILPYFDN